MGTYGLGELRRVTHLGEPVAAHIGLAAFRYSCQTASSASLRGSTIADTVLFGTHVNRQHVNRST